MGQQPTEPEKLNDINAMIAVEYVATYWNPNNTLTQYVYRINSREYTIEFTTLSRINIGRQLGLEIERIFNQVQAARRYDNTLNITDVNLNSDNTQGIKLTEEEKPNDDRQS